MQELKLKVLLMPKAARTLNQEPLLTQMLLHSHMEEGEGQMVDHHMAGGQIIEGNMEGHMAEDQGEGRMVESHMVTGHMVEGEIPLKLMQVVEVHPAPMLPVEAAVDHTLQLLQPHLLQWPLQDI
mmetsp:Transcript_31919/g.33154  ORF Transcript_31919/g.33154 Transcript_31919/m.33154 type:complete len:125 (+) Transcript_31919:1206-1580(+)